jgi:ADP-heptose:LPS heptosyltransferase
MDNLIYHAGALGDFVTTLPAFEWWRQMFPRSRIVIAGRPEFAQLVLRAGSADEVWDLSSAEWAGFFQAEPGPESLERLHRFDAALLFVADASPLPKILGQAGISRIWRQPPFPRHDIPIIQYHLSLFGQTAMQSAQADPYGSWREKFLAKVGALPERPAADVLIHPGSGSVAKNWPWARFQELASRFRLQGRRVAWLLGPAEEGWPLPLEDFRLIQPDLVKLAAILSQMRLYLGNDSGVTHLAAAMGCPTLALFGPAPLLIWAPQGRKVEVISSSIRAKSGCHSSKADAPPLNLEAISVEEVERASNRILDEELV